MRPWCNTIGRRARFWRQISPSLRALLAARTSTSSAKPSCTTARSSWISSRNPSSRRAASSAPRTHGRDSAPRTHGREPSIPTAVLAAVLLVEPRGERGVIIEQSAGIHRALPRDREERVRPRLARAELQHGDELLACRRVAVDRALVKWPRVAGGTAERAVKLVLQNARDEVAR